MKTQANYRVRNDVPQADATLFAHMDVYYFVVWGASYGNLMNSLLIEKATKSQVAAPNQDGELWKLTH